LNTLYYQQRDHLVLAAIAFLILASFLATLASFSFLVNLLVGKILLETSPLPLVDLTKSGFFLISL